MGYQGQWSALQARATAVGIPANVLIKKYRTNLSEVQLERVDLDPQSQLYCADSQTWYYFPTFDSSASSTIYAYNSTRSPQR